MPGRREEDLSLCTATLTLLQQRCQNIPDCMTQPPPAVISLRGNNFNIGRTLSSNAVVHSLQISRKHCVFEYKDSKWWIEDFSTNGIEINGQMLRKGVPGCLSNNDLIHMIPGGILSYRFDYTNSRPTSPTSQEELTGVLPIAPPQDDEGNASDESESLLNLGNGEDMFESANSTGFDLNENDLQILDPPDNPMARNLKGPGQKRNSEVLGTKRHRESKKKNTRGEIETKLHGGAVPTCVTIGDEEDEELLDLEDEPVVILSPQRKVIKTEPRETLLRSPVRAPAAPSSSSSSPPKQDCVETLDRDVLSRQLKYFTDRCRELTNEKSLVVLNATIDKDELKREIDRVKSEAYNQKTELFQKLASVLDTELNCCICNEIYMQAAVIDCGHTFCNHCICEWKKKQSNCPVCRTAITKCSKQIELNNFLLKIHSLLPEELQGRRDQLLKERETEVNVAKAVEEAETEERQAQGGRGGAAGGQGTSNPFYLNQWEFDGVNFGDLLGNWTAANQLGGGVPGIALPRTAQISRRSPRARRARVEIDPVEPAALPPRAARRGGAGPRGRYRAAVAVARLPEPTPPAAAVEPDLITLDDSQDFGGVAAALPAPLIPTPAPRARNNGGIMNTIWQSLVGPNAGA